MTEKEVQEAFEEMRKQGATDDDILGTLYMMYQDNKLNTNQLREMIDILGYEFTEDFEAMSEEDKHTKGYEFEDDEDVEDYNKKIYTFDNNYRALNKYVMDHTIKMCNEDKDLKYDISCSLADQMIVYQDDELKNVPTDGPTTNIIVSKKRTFEAAEQYVGKKIAVLNFANNHSVGGAPWSAGAQEESLCRCSTLYPCIKAAEIPFYQKHRDEFSKGTIGMLGSDDLIYTPRITVFKTDESAPFMRDSDEWFHVDVITSAAPEFRGEMEYAAIADVLYRRLRKVFEIAKLHKVEVLILGAYGCGAFGNPPKIVAQVFRTLLEEFKFETVEFAVYCTNYDAKSNYAIFKDYLGAISKSKFTLLTRYLPILKSISCTDMNKETPYEAYKAIEDLMKDIYLFEEQNPEYDLCNYSNILNDRFGKEFDIKRIDVYQLDEKTVLALLLAAVRDEHFDSGAFMRYVKAGYIMKWLDALRIIDEQ